MRLFGHPLVRHLTMMCGSQLGKTEFLLNCLLWLIDNDPAPTITMLANIDAAKAWNVERFIPALMACPRLMRHLTSSPQDLKTEKVTLGPMDLFYVGANSKQGRRMRPCRVRLADEVGAYEDPEWVEIDERVKTYGDYKLLDTSSPGDEGTGVGPLYKLGDREQYFVPCPACGEFQVLKFGRPGVKGGLSWEGGTGGTIAEVKASAHYVCERCHARIDEWQKPAMLGRGVWVPQGWDLERAATLTGNPESDVEELDTREPEHASFQLSSLYSPFPGASWAECAAAFVKTGGGAASKPFVTGWLGEEWSVVGDKAEVGELRRLCIPAAQHGYRMGEIVPQVLGLTMCVDVQADRLVIAVRGWGLRGEDTWLVQATEVDRIKGRNLTELDEWLSLGASRRVWRDQTGTRSLFPRVVGIDGRHFTEEVYTAVRRLRSRGVNAYATMGMGIGGGANPRIPHNLTVIDKWPGGEPMAGGVQVLLVNTNFFKTALMARIKGRAEEIAEDGGGVAGEVRGFYLPENTDGALEPYLDQMTSEHRVEDLGTVKSPRRVFVWMRRPGRYHNHYWDAEYNNLAVADRFGIRTLGIKPKAEPVAEPQKSDGPFGRPPWQRA